GKLGKLSRPSGDEAALDCSLPRDAVSRHRFGKSLEFAQLKIIASEHGAEELVCARGGNDCIWWRYVPQSGSHDDGFSDDCLIFPNKDHAGRNAEPHLQSLAKRR